MSNPNESKSYGRQVRQESYNDANGHTHVTRTSEVNNVPNPNAYRDGYVEGRVTENHYQEEVLAERDNENAGRGLLIGILLTSLAALTAGAIWYYNQRNDDVPPTIVVPNSQPAPSPSPEARQETTIIEKTRDVPVPVVVPQQQAPAPQAPAPQAPAPDINISVPNSVTQPPAQEAPATQSAPTQSESQSSSTDTQSTQSSTDTTTPSAGTSSQTDTTSGSSSSPSGGSTGDSAQ